MRPILTTVLALSVVVAACDAGPAPVALDADYTIESLGTFERVDEDLPLWVGFETVRIADRDGALVCHQEWDVDAAEALDACTHCEVTLDVIRSQVQELAEDCLEAIDASDQAYTRRRQLLPASATVGPSSNRRTSGP